MSIEQEGRIRLVYWLQFSKGNQVGRGLVVHIGVWDACIGNGQREICRGN